MRIEGRNVIVNTRNTQTVKVCTPVNIRGQYECYFRIRPPFVLSVQQLEEKIGTFSVLSDLQGWLTENRRAVREADKEHCQSCDPVDSDPELPPKLRRPANDLPRYKEYDPGQDTWLVGAKEIARQAVNRALDDFLFNPYCHRVEHSFHGHLMRMLMCEPIFGGLQPIGNTGSMTQLIHKEWPESRGRGGRRRGNFDIGILSPSLLAQCTDIVEFRAGILPAPIVIEIGLDYDMEHLQNDFDKLQNSSVYSGILLHLEREDPHGEDMEQAIRKVCDQRNCEVAYGSAFEKERWCKYLHDDEFYRR